MGVGGTRRNVGRWSGLLALWALTLVGLLAGCGGSTSTTTTSAGDRDTEGAGADAREDVVVRLMPTPELGHVIVDSEGMTLYEFRRDEPMLYEFAREPTPSCYGTCATAWPPVLTDDEPEAAGGADASMLGTIARKDGTTQVTYDGHPLYRCGKDSRPGDTNGHGLTYRGAEWHAVERDGDEYIASVD